MAREVFVYSSQCGMSSSLTSPIEAQPGASSQDQAVPFDGSATTTITSASQDQTVPVDGSATTTMTAASTQDQTVPSGGSAMMMTTTTLDQAVPTAESAIMTTTSTSDQEVLTASARASVTALQPQDEEEAKQRPSSPSQPLSSAEESATCLSDSFEFPPDWIPRPRSYTFVESDFLDTTRFSPRWGRKAGSPKKGSDAERERKGWSRFGRSASCDGAELTSSHSSPKWRDSETTIAEAGEEADTGDRDAAAELPFIRSAVRRRDPQELPPDVFESEDPSDDSEQGEAGCSFSCFVSRSAVEQEEEKAFVKAVRVQEIMKEPTKGKQKKKRCRFFSAGSSPVKAEEEHEMIVIVSGNSPRSKSILKRFRRPSNEKKKVHFNNDESKKEDVNKNSTEGTEALDREAQDKEVEKSVPQSIEEAEKQDPQQKGEGARDSIGEPQAPMEPILAESTEEKVDIKPLEEQVDQRPSDKEVYQQPSEEKVGQKPLDKVDPQPSDTKVDSQPADKMINPQPAEKKVGSQSSDVKVHQQKLGIVPQPPEGNTEPEAPKEHVDPMPSELKIEPPLLEIDEPKVVEGSALPQPSEVKSEFQPMEQISEPQPPERNLEPQSSISRESVRPLEYSGASGSGGSALTCLGAFGNLPPSTSDAAGEKAELEEEGAVGGVCAIDPLSEEYQATGGATALEVKGATGGFYQQLPAWKQSKEMDEEIKRQEERRQRRFIKDMIERRDRQMREFLQRLEQQERQAWVEQQLLELVRQRNEAVAQEALRAGQEDEDDLRPLKCHIRCLQAFCSSCCIFRQPDSEEEVEDEDAPASQSPQPPVGEIQRPRQVIASAEPGLARPSLSFPRPGAYPELGRSRGGSNAREDERAIYHAGEEEEEGEDGDSDELGGSGGRHRRRRPRVTIFVGTDPDDIVSRSPERDSPPLRAPPGGDEGKDSPSLP